MHPQDQLLVSSSFVVGGLVTFGVSLPLLYRKVRMNRFYGIRIAESFVSDARWYEINEYGGRLLVRWSWPITLSGIVGFFVPSQFSLSYLCVAVAILLVSALAPLIQTIRWAKATR